MLKNHICIFLTVLFVYVFGFSAGISESFTIRDGISFGMTREEVKAFEKKKGNPEETSYSTYSGFGNMLYFNQTIFGHPYTTVGYTFSKEDKLISFRYYFYKKGRVLLDSTEVYERLEASLKKKYGAPQRTESYNTLSDYAPEYLLATYREYTDKSNRWYIQSVLFDEWIVYYEDCAVLIELFCGIRNNTVLSKITYETCLYYTMIPYSEIQIPTDYSNDL